SGLKATFQPPPLKERRSWPVCASHTCTVHSPTLARRLLSGLKTTPETPPLRERSSLPVCASHTFTVLSNEALARRLLSGLKATLVIKWVCPLRERHSWKVWASHTFTSPGLPQSPSVVAKRLPSGLKATPSPAPLRERSSWPVCASHTFPPLDRRL